MSRAHASAASRAKTKIEAAGGTARGASQRDRAHLQSFANIFSIPDLRKRVLFTFGAARRLPARRPRPDARASTPRRSSTSSSSAGGHPRASWTSSRAAACERLTVFALGIMPYISASIILQLLTVVWPVPREALQGRREGRKKITQYTRYGTVAALARAVLGIAVWPREHRRLASGAADRAASGLGLPAHDHAHAHHRHRLHHVAGRADHRARHRQRHLADHLRRHRGRPARARSCSTPSSCIRTGELSSSRSSSCSSSWWRSSAAIVFMERGAAPDPGAVRQARGRPARVRRPDHPPAAARQHRGRHPGDLRLVDHRCSRRPSRAVRPAAAGCSRVVASRSRRGTPLYYLLYVGAASSSSAYFYTAIVFNPTTWRTTCGSTAASSPASARASGRPSTSTTSSRRITFGGAIYLALVAVLPEFLITGFKVAPSR